MITKGDIQKINDYLYEIPKTYRKEMLVPARIYADEDILDAILSDRTLEQLVNVASLPGIQKYAFVLPDAHEGYGFPIGAVAATSYPDGAISPGGIGYDINCGVRLLLSDLTRNDIEKHLERLAYELYKAVPSGVGVGGRINLSDKELDTVLSDGIEWAKKKGFAIAEDQEFIESNGRLESADPGKISNQAKERGQDQLGTIGAGNHFAEVDYVEEIFDKDTAEVFGLFLNQITVLLHTGSRGLGHQVATDYIRKMLSALDQYKISLPDPELACAPFSSSRGQDYFCAMSAAANFAWVNRQIITYEIRNVFKKTFLQDLRLLYDVAHNIAKIEEHKTNQGKQKLVVHRKGATRAFGSNHKELPQKYKSVGQPVLVPGSMGSASYVLSGTEKSMEEAFGSSCHGAGRVMSRKKAKKQLSGKSLLHNLRKEGIFIATGNIRDLSEEAPFAYKDIGEVVAIISEAGIGKKIARLKPLVVVKG